MERAISTLCEIAQLYCIRHGTYQSHDRAMRTRWAISHPVTVRIAVLASQVAKCWLARNDAPESRSLTTRAAAVWRRHDMGREEKDDENQAGNRAPEATLVDPLETGVRPSVVASRGTGGGAVEGLSGVTVVVEQHFPLPLQ